MRRREFIFALAGGAARPLAARAQQAAVPVIGFLSGRSPGDSVANIAAFRRGLREGADFAEHGVEIDFRWAFGRYEELADLAADLVRHGVKAIVATGGGVQSAQAAMAATATIPIVFVAGGDPLQSRLITSFNKPGGNVTGISFLISSLMTKKLGLLHELIPNVAAVGILVNPKDPELNTQLHDARTATQALGQKMVVATASNDEDLQSAFETFVQQQVGALVVAADPFFHGRVEQLVDRAARRALPAIYSLREYAAAGGLMSYGTSITDAHRQAGVYVGRILRGAQPAELPVVQSAGFEFVINVKTAKALGLDVPLTLLARADEVIE
jgi:putative tryptophan/tyrosine transport system substrate-binding protein